MTGDEPGETAENRREDHGTEDRTRTVGRVVRSQGRRAFLSAVGVAGLAATGASARHVPAGRTDAVVGDVDDGDPTGIDSCVTITEPGEYELTDDVVSDRPGPCIRILSSDVTLRGNGHRIERGDDGISGVSVFPEITDTGDPHETGEFPEPPDSLENVTVENVAVEGFQSGVVTGYVSNATLEAVGAHHNTWGIVLALGTHHADVSDCVSTDNQAGISVRGDPHGQFLTASSDNATIEHCEIVGNWTGISFEDGTANGTVALCRITDNTVGVYHSGFPVRDHVYRDNVICRNESGGVRNTADLEAPVPGVIVDATDNYWGASNGPSSLGDPIEPLTDPETGRPADGDGDAVSEGVDRDGVANVRFDPFSEDTVEAAGPRE